MLAGLAFLAIASAQYLWSMTHQPVWHCGCGSLISQASIGRLASGGGMMGIAVFFLGRAAWMTGKRWREMRTWQRHGLTTQKLDLHLPADVCILNEKTPRAFSAGWWQPRMYISAGLLDRLNNEEVAAVIKHERAHCAARDPFWSAVMEIIGATFFWLPFMRSWVTASYSLREMAADEQATEGYVQVAELASAMSKLTSGEQPGVIPAFSPNRDRIEKLLDRDWRFPFQLWSVSASVGALFVVGILFGAVKLVQAGATVTSPVAAAACRQIVRVCALPPSAPHPMSEFCLHGQGCYSVAPIGFSQYGITRTIR